MSSKQRDISASATPLDLTVVIVNYNVRYFLEQCLHSVLAACKSLRAEIYVVDNASSDSSGQLVDLFPQVTYIANAQNVGFAKANNQAIRLAKGRYVLLLNPDTLIPEDSLEKCLAYMDARPKVGNLGVRMIDGRGVYLPESKRGFPSAWVSFTKMSGLAKLAPQSKRFNGYYLGHLDEHATNEVDVLPGAFMWLRREALDAAGGGLDETYFMYGEDVDLSYTIEQEGYANVYFPEVTILHYKGESTRKRSLRYVRSFYEAMAIFSDKHVTGSNSSLHRFILRSAIYARATLALIINALVAILPVLVDVLTLVVTLLVVKILWARYYFEADDYYTAAFDAVNVPLYAGLWLLGLTLFGAYDRPLRLQNAWRGLGLGTILVLIAYALLPVEYRTSRAIILLTSVASGAMLLLTRLLWSQLRPSDVSFSEGKVGRDRRLAIIGSQREADRCLALLGKSGIARNYLGRIAPADASNEDATALYGITDVDRAIENLSLDEFIICSADLSVAATLSLLEKVGDRVEVRTLAPKAQAIVGSPSPNAPGQTYSLAVDYALASAHTRRRKRTLDVGIAILVLILFPLSLLTNQALGTLRNAVLVLLGRRTWVGYNSTQQVAGLPTLALAVLQHNATTDKDNELYAKFYSAKGDLKQILAQWRRLGQPARWASRSRDVQLANSPATVAEH